MSDSELLHASRAGSKEAFGVVVQRYQSLVCAITYSATGDIGKSEELAQETFLRGWKNLGQLEDWVSFSAILACDTLVFLAVAEVCARNPQRYWSIAVVLVGALMAVTWTVVNLRWIAWMRAYRQSAAYDPMNDVSLTTINLVILGAFVALLSAFATRYVRHKARRKDFPPQDPKSG